MTKVINQREAKTLQHICVMITCYNYGKYITTALDSVMQQTVSLDIVVIDDCSTDNSLKIIHNWFRKYGSKFNSFIILKNKVNKGVAASRNIALSYIKNDFVFVLDADNILYPHCIEKLHKGISFSNCEFAYALMERFGNDNLLVNNILWDAERFKEGNYIDNMALFKRTALESVGGYAEGVNGLEDYELYIKFALIGYRGCRVPEILYRYFAHNDSMTIKVIRKKYDMTMNIIRKRHPYYFSKEFSSKIPKPKLIIKKALNA